MMEVRTSVNIIPYLRKVAKIRYPNPAYQSLCAVTAGDFVSAGGFGNISVLEIEKWNEAIKSVASAPKQDRFAATRVVDKDSTIIDDNSEDWATLISQFTRITKFCEYSSEEMMVKPSLQYQE
ncbi:hypothetical protein JTB14_001887 [Gonioctena quinquepunctata]|nr:hypothetical protein JTB14_001887 [Gonioctena quinquepunctata]